MWSRGPRVQVPSLTPVGRGPNFRPRSHLGQGFGPRSRFGRPRLQRGSTIDVVAADAASKRCPSSAGSSEAPGSWRTRRDGVGASADVVRQGAGPVSSGNPASPGLEAWALFRRVGSSVSPPDSHVRIDRAAGNDRENRCPSGTRRDRLTGNVAQPRHRPAYFFEPRHRSGESTSGRQRWMPERAPATPGCVAGARSLGDRG